VVLTEAKGRKDSAGGGGGGKKLDIRKNTGNTKGEKLSQGRGERSECWFWGKSTMTGPQGGKNTKSSHN